MRNRKPSKIPLALLLLFAMVGFALAFSPTPVFAAGCGITITTSTTLNASLGPCPNDGLVIGASGITLNCAGYTVSGESNPSQNVAGIDLAGVTGVTVENCNVTGFEYGIYLYGSSGNTLTGNTANGNLEDGFYLGGSSGNTLTENTANINSGYGYYDLTTGTGTAGTANTYVLDICIGNSAGRSSPSGTCAPVYAEPITPSAPAVDSGQPVTLTANRYGGIAPYSYQWYTGAGCTAAIAGATSATYVASPVTTTTYYYKVTDSETTPATACSSGDTVTVRPDPTVAVTPAGPLSYDVGQTASALAAAVTYTGPNTVSVEWYSSATSSCSSASTDTHRSGLSYIPGTSTAGTTYYCAVVSDSGVSGYHYASNAVGVTVHADPTVAVAPAGPLSYDLGQTASALTATVTYSGPNTASVEWYGSSTSSCSSASTDTHKSGLSYTPSTSTSGTTYYCAVVSDSGVAGYNYASNAVEVVVHTGPIVAVTPAGPLSYDLGQTASALAAAVTYTGPNTVSVEWYSSATSSCSSASTDTGTGGLSYTPSTSTSGTTYYCAVVFEGGVPAYSYASNAVEVTVHADPTVAVTPAGPLSYNVGQTASALAAAVTYTGPNTASVEWYSSATSSCSSASTDTHKSGLSYTPSTSTSGTTYYCAVVSDSGVSGYHYASNAVEVTVKSATTTSTTSTKSSTPPPPPPTTTTTSSTTTSSTTTTTSSTTTTTTALPTTTYTTTFTRPATITQTQTETSSTTITARVTAPTTATVTATTTTTSPRTTVENLRETKTKTTIGINFWILLIPLLILLLLIILLLAIRAWQSNETNP